MRGMMVRKSLKAVLAVFSFAILNFLNAHNHATAQGTAGVAPVDTALIVSVDVSNSVDEERYRLQMEGIATALEDKSVIDAILNGEFGAILFSLMTWADQPNVLLPWVRISSAEDAKALAAKLRALPRQSGEFTCMSRMMRSVNDKIIPQIPAPANRVVIDISGDGPDNCNAQETTDTVRDELVASSVVVNGLPIVVKPEQGATYGNVSDIEQWFRDHVMGGNGSFVLPADGYADFGRAIRQKFVIEISGLSPPAVYAGRDSARVR